MIRISPDALAKQLISNPHNGLDGALNIAENITSAIEKCTAADLPHFISKREFERSLRTWTQTRNILRKKSVETKPQT